MREQPLLACAPALRQQLARVVRIFDVLVPIEAARVPGHELVAVVQAHAIGIGLQKQPLAHVTGRDRVMIGLEGNAKLRRGAHVEHARQIEAGRIQWAQLRSFLLEAIDRPLMRGAVHAHVGHRVDPQRRRRLQRAEVGKVQSGEEIFLDVPDPVFNATFFMGLSHVAGGDLEAPMTREVQILRIEHRCHTRQPLQHRRAQVVDHDAGRAAAEGGKGVLVAAEEELHRLRHGELQVHPAAVAQHHQEEAQAPARGAHTDGAEGAPVHLGTLARGEGERQKRRARSRPDPSHVVLHDRDAAREARLAQPLPDLLRAVGVRIEPAHDLALERIEPARARGAHARPKLLDHRPLGHRLRMQSERACGLRQRQMLAAEVVVDPAEGLIVDHGATPAGPPATAPAARAPSHDRMQHPAPAAAPRRPHPAVRAPGRPAPRTRPAATR